MRPTETGTSGSRLVRGAPLCLPTGLHYFSSSSSLSSDWEKEEGDGEEVDMGRGEPSRAEPERWREGGAETGTRSGAGGELSCHLRCQESLGCPDSKYP